MQISKEKILEFYRIANGNQEVFEALLAAYEDGQEAGSPTVTVTPLPLPEPTPLQPHVPYPWEVARPWWTEPFLERPMHDLKPPWTITCRA